MKNFLLLCLFTLALVSSANAFKVSAPANAEGDKTATKKEAVDARRANVGTAVKTDHPRCCRKRRNRPSGWGQR